MKNNKLKLMLYITAVLMILVPISKVLITGISYNSTYSKISISMALMLVIVGKVHTVFRTVRKDNSIPKAGIGSIIGLLIVLFWGILK